MIRFRCPSCRKSLRVPPELAGRTGKCPGCGTKIIIPKESDPDVPEPPARVPVPAPQQPPERSEDLVVYAAQATRDVAKGTAKGIAKVTGVVTKRVVETTIHATGVVRDAAADALTARPVQPPAVPVQQPAIPASFQVPQAPGPGQAQQIVVIQQNNAQQATGNATAVFALCMAALSMMFALVPFLGLLSIPFSFVSMVLALVGLVVALTRGFAGGTLAIIAFVVAALALPVSLLSTSIFAKVVTDQAKQQEAQP